MKYFLLLLIAIYFTGCSATPRQYVELIKKEVTEETKLKQGASK